MDGNGRWAKERGHSRAWGHVRGSSVVSKIVEEADDLGVSALTLYAFSTENWGRPLEEINTLFNLLKKFLKKERSSIIENRIRFKVMGDLTNLPEETKQLIQEIETETSHYQGLKLTFAFGYGGRLEIIDSIKTACREKTIEEVTIEDVTNNLYVSDLGDVDLLIRTGGDHRISNFLLWQIAYAEIYFSETRWPDFGKKELRRIIEHVVKRERRFGSIGPMDSLRSSIHLADKNKVLLSEEQSSP